MNSVKANTPYDSLFIILWWRDMIIIMCCEQYLSIQWTCSPSPISFSCRYVFVAFFVMARTKCYHRSWIICLNYTYSLRIRFCPLNVFIKYAVIDYVSPHTLLLRCLHKTQKITFKWHCHRVKGTTSNLAQNKIYLWSFNSNKCFGRLPQRNAFYWANNHSPSIKKSLVMSMSICSVHGGWDTEALILLKQW